MTSLTEMFKNWQSKMSTVDFAASAKKGQEAAEKQKRKFCTTEKSIFGISGSVDTCVSKLNDKYKNGLGAFAGDSSRISMAKEAVGKVTETDWVSKTKKGLEKLF